MLGFAGFNNALYAKPPCPNRERFRLATRIHTNPADKQDSAAYTAVQGAQKDEKVKWGKSAMVRISVYALVLANLLSAGTARAQHLDTSMSDKQIVTNILKECHELYARTVGDCACAADRTKDGARCNKVVKDLPESFKPFCTRKDVTLREVSMYRMQNQGFIDRRCSK